MIFKNLIRTFEVWCYFVQSKDDEYDEALVDEGMSPKILLLRYNLTPSTYNLGGNCFRLSKAQFGWVQGRPKPREQETPYDVKVIKTKEGGLNCGSFFQFLFLCC